MCYKTDISWQINDFIFQYSRTRSWICFCWKHSNSLCSTPAVFPINVYMGIELNKSVKRRNKLNTFRLIHYLVRVRCLVDLSESLLYFTSIITMLTSLHLLLLVSSPFQTLFFHTHTHKSSWNVQVWCSSHLFHLLKAYFCDGSHLKNGR